MERYFPKPNFLEPNVKVELDLSNQAIKTDSKNAIGLIHQNLLKMLIYQA